MSSPIIIAEACQNHNGDREILKRLIHEAADSGADYVKIQAVKSEELTFRERFEEGEIDQNGKVLAIKRPYRDELERLSNLDLTEKDEEWYVEECKKAGVRSMITAFTRSSINRIKKYDIDALKIASYDCASYPLLEDIIKISKPIFLSTGATYDHEIKKAVNILKNSELTVLHCVTIYPTPLKHCNLNKMDWLKKLVPNVGWSDHTLVKRDGIIASKIALALGANCIERHFTVLDDDKTKDGPVSINPKYLKEIRNFADKSQNEKFEIINSDISNWKICLGSNSLGLSEEEKLNRDYYRGRFASKVNNKFIYNWENISPNVFV